MYSPDLVSYATSKGWYTSGPFNFAQAYGDPATEAATWNTHRETRVKALLETYTPAVKPFDLMSS